MTPKAVLEKRGLGYAHVEANRDVARQLLNAALYKASDAESSLAAAAFYAQRRHVAFDEEYALVQIDRAFSQLEAARSLRAKAKTYARLAVRGEWRTCDLRAETLIGKPETMPSNEGED